MSNISAEILAELEAVVEQRKLADPENSYVASLFKKGQDKILQKVGEEAVELILASKSNESDQIIYETADLLFHTVVMLSYHDIKLDSVVNELHERFGTSGLVEKASREKPAG